MPPTDPEPQFLDSPDRWVRRASAAAYCVATAVATVVVLLSATLSVDRGDGLAAGALTGLFPALILWWIAAGVGLRVVRFAAGRRTRNAAHARR